MISRIGVWRLAREARRAAESSSIVERSSAQAVAALSQNAVAQAAHSVPFMASDARREANLLI